MQKTELLNDPSLNFIEYVSEGNKLHLCCVYDKKRLFIHCIDLDIIYLNRPRKICKWTYICRLHPQIFAYINLMHLLVGFLLQIIISVFDFIIFIWVFVRRWLEFFFGKQTRFTHTNTSGLGLCRNYSLWKKLLNLYSYLTYMNYFICFPKIVSLMRGKFTFWFRLTDF